MAHKLKTKENQIFKIKVKKRFFLSSSALFGDIFFEFEDSFFPSENWNDFILIILDWWLNAALELIDKKTTGFLFMDGPYEVSITLDDSRNCKMKFIERKTKAKNILKTISLPLNKLINELIVACQSLFEAIEKPEALKLIKSADEVETPFHMSLSKEIERNSQISEDYQRLKKSYELVCKYRKTIKI